jgi:hypothetical protein
MNPEIIIALISSLTTIIVAFIQFRKPKGHSTQSQSKINWKLISLFIGLNIITIVAALLWIYAGLVDIGGEAREYQELIDEAKKNNKPYILESVTVSVKLTDSVKIRKAEVRIN